MPKYVEGLNYHLYNRGAHRAPIFLVPGNYHYCLRLLFKYSTKYRVFLQAYCLMPNHYHLILRQEPGGSVSRCVQTVFNAYVQGFNKIHRHSGTLFKGEAQSRLIDSDDYAVQVIRYVHLNPVRAGIVPTPEAWDFSDYRDWVTKGGTTNGLRNTFFQDGNSYKEFVNAYSVERDWPGLTKYVFGF